MHLIINRNILNNKFETVVSFESFGGVDITPEEERALLENFPVSVNLSEIEFTGKFEADGAEVLESDDVGAEEVKLSVPQRMIKVDDSFIAKYEVSVSDILDNELGTRLSTKELVCQAKARLFEVKVVDKVRELLSDLKLKNTKFEEEAPIKVTV